MTALALANAAAHAAAHVATRVFSSIRRGLSRLRAAYVQVQEARLEAEIRRIRHRIRPRGDDDRPTTSEVI